MRERLHVLDQGRRAVDAAFEWVGRRVGRRAEAVVDQVDGGGLSTGDVARGSGRDADQPAVGFGALAEGAEHGVARGRVPLADVEHDPSRAQHARGDEGSVEDEMRPRRHQGAVLLALRLALGAIDHDHGVAARPLGHGAPLDAGGEGRATATSEAGSFQRIDEHPPGGRQGGQAVRRVQQRHHGTSRRSTAARNAARCGASGSGEPVVRRCRPPPRSRR